MLNSLLARSVMNTETCSTNLCTFFFQVISHPGLTVLMARAIIHRSWDQWPPWHHSILDDLECWLEAASSMRMSFSACHIARSRVVDTQEIGKYSQLRASFQYLESKHVISKNQLPYLHLACLLYFDRNNGRISAKKNKWLHWQGSECLPSP